jgi:two-component system nitrogen regulation response regulator GlnG
MPTLLVIDDEPAIRHAFQKAFGAPVALRLATTAAEGLAAVATDRPDVVVLDVHLPDATGLDTFRRLRAIDARIPVILVTGHGTTDLAIQAMTEGAYEYLLKPLELPELRRLIDRALQSAALMRTPAAMPEVEAAPPAADVLLGRCPAMQEVYKAVGRVARQNVTVLVRGESGTGKELVARAVYQHSARADKPFLAINCAAIPESLLEAELFGHEKGAFTGADRKRIGKFEQCSGGTIFLDEIGDMTPLTQAKVLRLIQDQQFERLGGTETVRTDVRLVAATNADLERLCDEGPVPPRPVLPPERLRRSFAAAARARRRRGVTRRSLRAAVRARARQAGGDRPGRRRGAARVPVAGQRARTAERTETVAAAHEWQRAATGLLARCRSRPGRRSGEAARGCGVRVGRVR